MLKFKFFIQRKLQERGNTILHAVSSYRDFDPDNIPSDEFRNYLRRSLLHSLAHMLYLYLVRELVPIDSERIGYWIDYDKYTIYVYENSKQDGLGLVETVAQLIKKKGMGAVFKEFLQKSEDFLVKHNNEIKSDQKRLQNESQQYLVQKLSKNQDINELIQEVDSLNNEINQSNVGLDNIDIISYRYLLVNRIKNKISDYDSISEYIIPVILRNGKPSLCLDGCDNCLIFRRGCTEPLLQNYIISKNLLLKFIDVLLLGKGMTIVKNGVKDILQGLFEHAQELRIEVPYIDQEGIDLLKEVKGKGTVKKIDLILKEAKDDILKQLKNLGIDVNIRNDFHAKIYELKSGDQRVRITGSANLTHSSLTENITIEVKIDESN